ncbi:unannotated protein [freshwater metagenome]|uniref:Unannotated protein n=1 Tax=freshwater metagenome TaxID=449393 RepID=A0A6J6Q1D8_9ZZZZ
MASTKSWSGMKYAVVIQMLRLARLIASRYIDRIGKDQVRGTLRCTRIIGSQVDAVSSSSGRSRAPMMRRRLRFHMSAKARLRSQTPGPVSCTWVSRHSVS